MDDTLFGWIHVSDIHFGHGDAGHGWDQKMVLDRLVQDLPEVIKQGAPRPDAILVTGDVAFSGAGRSPDEYQRAEVWLLQMAAAVGLGPDRIFMVPGNHDVNRRVDAKLSIGTLVDALRDGKIPLDTVLADPEARDLLGSRMSKYLELAARFAPALPPLFWVQPLQGRGGLKVRLCGLNTALLSRDDTDQGKLQLGKQQLDMVALPAAAPGELVIVLTHHPLRAWLSDGKNAEEWIHSSAHLHLSGHVHEAESAEVRKGVGTHFVHITAGAAHGEKSEAASHGYNFAAVVAGADGRLGLRTWPRRWSEKGASFRLDFEAVNDGERFAYHQLRASLPAAAQAAPRVPAPVPAPPPPPVTPAPVVAPKAADKPLEVFVSFAKPNEADADEVLKRLRSININYRLKNLPPLLEVWTARSVLAGQDMRREIAGHVGSADIVLLLVSDDYLASPDLVEDEMLAAVERHRRSEIMMLPILLTPCDFAATPFAGLQFLPKHMSGHDHRPVSTMKRDEAFLQIQQGIQLAAEGLRKRR